MATIAIAETNTAVAELIATVIGRLGHTPVHVDVSERLTSLDALVFDPADAGSLGWARIIHLLHPALPLICVSSGPAVEQALELEAAAYLLKPFALAALEEAIRAALA
jgi:DNA-binding response OmpR family regulator